MELAEGAIVQYKWISCGIDAAIPIILDFIQGQDFLKAELYALCRSHEPKPEYKIDKIVEAAGYTILRTPQYHPEFQPIKMCWGIAKNLWPSAVILLFINCEVICL